MQASYCKSKLFTVKNRDKLKKDVAEDKLMFQDSYNNEIVRL